MEKILLLISFLSLFVGCERNEIELYNQDQRINFMTTLSEVIFRDTHYVRGITEQEIDLKLILQGDLLKENRIFCLKSETRENYSLKGEVTLADHYTYSALDTVIQLFNAKVSRPARLAVDTAYQVNICFDYDNPKHQFQQGRVDKDSCRVSVYYIIQPTYPRWNTYAWGVYSDAKYFFMMDHFKSAHHEIPSSVDNRKAIYDAYAKYREKNPPILDDKGKEIEFKNQ